MAEAKFLNRATRYRRRVKEPGRKVRRGPTTHYIWRIDPEELPRTRLGHRRLNGRMFSWDDPPVVDSTTGERGHPGLDKHCRCWAEPVPDEEPALAPAESSAGETRREAQPGAGDTGQKAQPGAGNSGQEAQPGTGDSDDNLRAGH